MNTVTYQGREVSVVEVNGGWTTIKDGGETRKVRNSELREVTPQARAAAAKEARRSGKAPTVTMDSVKTDRKPKTRGPKADQPGQGVDLQASADDADARLVRADLSHYVVSDEIRTASGRKAIDSGDEVAERLRGASLDDVYREAAQTLGTTQKELREKYAHLNPGMQRMNLGNRIRGALRAAAAE